MVFFLLWLRLRPGEEAAQKSAIPAHCARMTKLISMRQWLDRTQNGGASGEWKTRNKDGRGKRTHTLLFFYFFPLVFPTSLGDVAPTPSLVGRFDCTAGCNFLRGHRTAWAAFRGANSITGAGHDSSYMDCTPALCTSTRGE